MREYINIINEASKPTIDHYALEKDFEIFFRKMYVRKMYVAGELHHPRYDTRHIEITFDRPPGWARHPSQRNETIKHFYTFQIKIPFWGEPDQHGVNNWIDFTNEILRRIKKHEREEKKHLWRGLPGKINGIFKKHIPDWEPHDIQYYEHIHEFIVSGFSSYD